MSKSMKKVLLTLMCVSALGAGLVACGDADNISNKFVAYDGKSITKTGKEGSTIKFPDIKRDGYALDGWYTTSDFSGEPVTSAKYKKGVTYYAKWSPVYEVEFDLDGGSFVKSTADKLPLMLREGAIVYDNVQDYVPTKGDLQFGCWFVGDDELSQTYAMTKQGVTLTAKYKAAYTINAYLQDDDLDGYTLHTEYLSGYDYVDEELTLPAVEGYTLADSDMDKPLELSEDSTKNVFTLHFDRKAFNVVYNANYPDGSDDVKIETEYYGVKFNLPNDMYRYDGYRFVGWASVENAEGSDIISGEYSVTRGTVLYAVWNRGYTDMFGGSDTIYVSPFGDGKATLCRGGIDIDGTYDAKRKIYTFEGTDGYELRAQVIESSGRFVYYSDRTGEAYYLYTDGAVNEKCLLTLDRTNGVEYISAGTGDKPKKGTYSINEMGIYVAEFEDGSSFEFLTGTAMDGSNRSIFRIRGDEYKYDAMGRLGAYYPVIMLDGFGNVLYLANATAKESYFTYTVTKTEDKEIITIKSMSSNMTVCIFEYDERYGYELYNAALDNAFTDGAKKLTLDGCSNATYKDGSKTVTGKFDEEQSVFGGYIVTLKSGTDNYMFRVYNEENEDNTVTHKLAILSDKYVEYRYLDPNGKINDEPFLVVNGNNTAALYEQHDGELELVSSGSFVKQGDSYLYTATGNIAEWSENQYTTLVVNLDTQSSSYKVYYRLSATDSNGDTNYTTVYNNADDDGTTLTIASAFAFYNDGKTTVTGVISDRTTYAVMVSGKASYYFALDKDNHTFERLARSPMVFTYRSAAGVASNSTTLTVTGKKISKDCFEAIYAVTSGGNTATTHGTYTAVNAAGLGQNIQVYTFVSDDQTLTFKFLTVAINNSSYFIYYDVDQTVELVTHKGIDELGNEVAGESVVLTDRTTAGGDSIVEYRHDDTVTDGICTEKTLTVFDKYMANVYTFTSVDGETTFEFTLVDKYFRRCAAVKNYTSEGGGTLTIDGRVHIARYVDSQENKFDGGYLVAPNVLDSEDSAVVLVVDENTILYFDLNTDEQTFILRGSEAATYMVFDNTFTTGRTIALDGHGHAKLTVGSGEPVSGTYTQQDGLYTVVIGEDKYIGRLDVVALNNVEYNAFILSMSGISGTYINKGDLSVLELDDVGNVVKYSSRGVVDYGTYVRIDDKTFYYVNGDSSDAAMYTIGANGTVVGANYNATYYADDFKSIVFYLSGALVINNDEVLYYTYDKASSKIYTYTPSNNGANEYGFRRAEFAITDNKITYNDVEYTYYVADTYVTLKDANQNTLEFKPTGAAEFSVEATYTKSGETKGDKGYWVIVSYDENGDVVVSLSHVENMSIAGSTNKYKVIAGAVLDVSLSDETFAIGESGVEYDVMAYDYEYMVGLATYDMNSLMGQLIYDRYYGQINIYGTVGDNGTIEYTVSGQINAIKPSGFPKKSITFDNGTLSRAGYYNDNYGNMYTAEFVGDDDNTYHMNFFLLQSGIDGMCVYIIYSCTRVQDSVELADGSVVYEEQFVYTTGFNITNPYKSTEDKVEYFVAGDKYYPTLKYKGDIICAIGCDELDDNTWLFTSRVYAGNSNYADYYYYYTFTVNDDQSITPTSVVRRFLYAVTENENNSVLVITGSATSAADVYDVMFIKYAGEILTVKTCVNNDNGSFTVTTDNDDVYTVVFSETEENETTKITVTITPAA